MFIKIMKIVVPMIILFVVFIITGWWVMFRYLPSQEGAKLTTIQLKSNIDSILRYNSTVSSYCKIAYKEDTEFYYNTSLKYDEKLENMTDAEYIVELNYNDKPSENSQCREIYTIFETYIYMRDKKMAENPIAISCWYSSGQFDDTQHTFIIIYIDELDEIYQTVINKQLDQNILAQKMSELWVDRYHYNRRGLNIDEENDYRKHLLTPFNNFVLNNNQDLAFRYTKDYGLSVVKIRKSTGGTSSTQEIFCMNNIDRMGLLYGSWDEQNNIWLYDETIGIMLLEFDGDSHWKQADYVDESKAPYALKRVMETKSNQ